MAQWVTEGALAVLLQSKKCAHVVAHQLMMRIYGSVTDYGYRVNINNRFF